jgi:hypothetical protein
MYNSFIDYLEPDYYDLYTLEEVLQMGLQLDTGWYRINDTTYLVLPTDEPEERAVFAFESRDFLEQLRKVAALPDRKAKS